MKWFPLVCECPHGGRGESDEPQGHAIGSCGKYVAEVDRLDAGMRGLRSDFNSSQTKLPGLIAEVMCEVLRENKG